MVTTILGYLKGQVELGYPNTCSKVKLCLFLFMPALDIVCPKFFFLANYFKHSVIIIGV